MIKIYNEDFSKMDNERSVNEYGFKTKVEVKNCDHIELFAFIGECYTAATSIYMSFMPKEFIEGEFRRHGFYIEMVETKEIITIGELVNHLNSEGYTMRDRFNNKILLDEVAKKDNLKINYEGEEE